MVRIRVRLWFGVRGKARASVMGLAALLIREGRGGG